MKRSTNALEAAMTNESRDLVVVVTHGIDHELSSVALTIARAGITAGLKVSLFLTSAGVDLVRRGAADTTHVKPLEPLADMFKGFPRARRRHLGLPTLHQEPRLCAGIADRRGGRCRRGQGARADQGRRGDAVLVRPNGRRRHPPAGPFSEFAQQLLPENQNSCYNSLSGRSAQWSATSGPESAIFREAKRKDDQAAEISRSGEIAGLRFQCRLSPKRNQAKPPASFRFA
jgi:hypothetical protein